MASLLIAISQKLRLTWEERLHTTFRQFLSRHPCNDYVQSKAGVSAEKITQTFKDAYQNKPLVRLYEKGVPALKSVVGTPFCDIGYVLKVNTDFSGYRR